jgi:hypothetical protein
MAIWRCTIAATYNGRIMMNQIHLEGPPEQEVTPTFVAGQVAQQWLPPILGSQSHGIHYFQIEIRQVLPSNNLGGQIVAISVDGNGSSDVHHACMSYKLRFRTGLLGRKFRGRYYIPACVQGFTNADVVNNIGNTFFTDACNLLTARFCGDTPTTGFNLVIYHRGPEASTTRVEQILHSNLLGIQSRRNVFRGI